MKTYLSLYEKLAWLNIEPHQHKRLYEKHQARYLYGLAGLVLLELILKRHIVWQGKDELKGVADNHPSDDLLLAVWELCTTPKKVNWFWLVGKQQTTAHSVKDWLKVIVSKIPKFTMRVEQQLAEKQYITVKEKKNLGLMSTTSLFVDIETQESYRKQLAVIVLENQKATLEDFVLLKVIKACKLHTLIAPLRVPKSLDTFYEQLSLWTKQKTENEAIINYLENFEFEKDLEELGETLDSLTDIVEDIADAVGEAGDSGDGGDGGGDGD